MSRVAWGWVEHLRAGGSTPWRDWDADGTDGGPLLPGALQLEVLRRVNRLDPNGAPAALADRILASSAPGRGQPDLELVGAAEPSRFGPRPVDPSALPEDELLRVATSVLADLAVAATAAPVHEAEQPRVLRRPFRRRYRLGGNPLVSDALREQLVARGHPPGGRYPSMIIVASDLTQMLADTWAWRVRHSSTPAWDWWVAHWADRDRLPPRLDLVTIAREWAEKLGREQVHVVIDEDVAPLLGVRRPLEPVVRLPHVALDVARHTNAVLRVLADRPRHLEVLDHALLPWLAPETGPGAVVPDQHLDWVRRQAGRMQDAITDAGYPVHGDPAGLMPAERPPGTAADPTDAGVVDAALRTLLRASNDPRTGVPDEEDR